MEGSTTLASTIAVGGVASFLTNALPVGTHTVTADFTSSSNYANSSSSAINVTITEIPTTISIASDLNPSTAGQAITYTATLSDPSATGVVTFKDGATVLGTGTIASGAATFTTSALTVGSHLITGEYAGDGIYAGSTSSALSQTVQAGGSGSSGSGSSSNGSGSGSDTSTATTPSAPATSVDEVPGDRGRPDAAGLLAGVVDSGQVSSRFTTPFVVIGSTSDDARVITTFPTTSQVRADEPGPRSQSVSHGQTVSVDGGAVSITVLQGQVFDGGSSVTVPTSRTRGPLTGLVLSGGGSFVSYVATAAPFSSGTVSFTRINSLTNSVQGMKEAAVAVRRAGKVATQQIGSFAVDADGQAKVSVVIPADARPGSALVSIASYRPDGTMQVVAFPVTIAPKAGERELRVVFGYQSSVLTARAMADLDALIARVPGNATVVSRARGLTAAQVDSPAGRLAADRAKAVAQHLAGRGVATTYGTTQARRPLVNAPRSRGVDVSISFRPSRESLPR